MIIHEIILYIFLKNHVIFIKLNSTQRGSTDCTSKYRVSGLSDALALYQTVQHGRKED